MKPRKSTPFRSHVSITAAFSVALFSHFAAPFASAAGGPYYWDNNGTTAGFGTAAGTWAATTTGSATQGWSTSAAGTLLPGNVTTDTTDTLNFGTSTAGNGLGAGTITVSGTVAAGNLTYGSQSGNIVLTGGTINLASASTITVSAGTQTIASVLSGATTSLTKAGGSVLKITGENGAITGGDFFINTGEVQVANGATSSGPDTLGNSNGWTVQLGNTSGTSTATLSIGNSFALPNPIVVRAGSSGTKTIGITSITSSTFSGVITANDNLTVLHDIAGTTGVLAVSNAGNTVASGKTVTFTLSTANTLTDSSTWGGAGKLAYGGAGNGTINVTGAKTHTGGSNLNTMSGTGVVSVNTSSTGPANTPTNGPFGTGTLTIGATRLYSTGADRTIANSITFSGNPTFPTIAGEKSLIFTGDASLVATRTLTVETGSTVTGKSVEFQGNISGGFGIIKAGAGVLTLSGASSYTGATTINAGTLNLSGSGSVNTSSGITVNGSNTKLLQTSSTPVSPSVTLTQGTLTGNGTLNSVNVGAGSGGIISNNNGVAGASLTIGALTFNGGATVNAFINNPSAPIATTSLASNAAGTVTINANSTVWADNTTYDLISYGGGSIGGGGFAQFALGAVTGLSARQTASTLGNSGTAITFTVSGDTPYWSGNGDGKWNLASTNNWKLVSNNNPALFLATDNVIFNDNATGTGPITVDIDAANVATNSTTFNNTSKDYVLTSTGGFGISSGNLTKNGTAKVTIRTVNTYTGTTIINAGTLVIDDGAISASSTIMNNAALEYKLNANPGSYANVISGTGSLTKTGTNTLTLSGTNTFTGGLNIAEGAVTLSSAAAAGDSTSVITFATGGATNATAQFSGAFTAVNPITVASGSAGTNTIANIGTGAVILNGAMNINTGTTLTVNSSSSNNSSFEYGAGIITGGGSLATTGTSTGNLILRGANTYSGGTTLGGSSILVPASSSNGPAGSPTDGIFGTGTVNIGAITIRSSSVLDITLGNPLTLAGDFTAATVSSEKSLTFSGPATLTGTRTITANVGTTVAGKSLTFSGNIGDSGSGYGIVKNGTGVLVLSGANTYSGSTTIGAGTLQISAAGNLGNGSATNNISLATATLQSTANSYDLGVNRAITLTGNGKILADADTLTVSGTVTNGANLFTLFGAGNINVSGVIGAGATPTGGLNIGSTTLPANVTLSGNNLFTGNVTLPANNTQPKAVLTLTHPGALGVGPKTVTSTGGNGTNGGQIHLQNNIAFASDISFTVSGFTIYNDSGSNTINGNITMTSGGGDTFLNSTSGTLTINGNMSANTTLRKLRLRGDGNGVITGNITNGSTVDLPLLKDVGAGTWTLTGTNNYTGSTTVSAGTLLVNGSLDAASAVSVTDATLGGNGTIGGSVTVAATGNLAPGASAGTLTIGGGLDISAQAAGTGTLSYELDALAGTNDKIAVTGTLTLGVGVLGFNNFAFTNLGGLQAGTYKLITSAGINPGDSLDGSNLSGAIGAFTGTLQITGGDLELVVSSGGAGPVDHFDISAIGSPQTVGTPITGITLTAKDASNAVASGFTGTVTFGGTAGCTGTSGNFVAGVLNSVSVTPTTAGSNLTLTVNDGASHTGSTTITTVQTQYEAWAGGAAFGTDTNSDGVTNGVAWVLGAANPAANATALLPTFDNTTDPVYFIYTYRRTDVANTAANTTIAVQYGSNLSSWTTAAAGPDIIITPTDDFYGVGIDKVQVKIKRTLAVGSKLFARLNVVQTP